MQCENCEKITGGREGGGLAPKGVGFGDGWGYGGGCAPSTEYYFNFLVQKCILAFILTTIASSVHYPIYLFTFVIVGGYARPPGVLQGALTGGLII